MATRTGQVIVSRDTRRAYLVRGHLRALRRINPNLRVVGVTDDGGATYVQASDSVISPWLIARGHFQRDHLIRGWAIARARAPRPNAKTFLDVGANVGTTTLYASRTGDFDRIVAVEPSPDNVHFLELNVMANNLSSQVHIAPVACGAEAGEVELILSSVSAGDHRVRRADDIPSSHPGIVAVQQRTLDDIVHDAGVDPSDVALAWVDTQGHEPGVMAGATSLLAARVPFIIEFWPEMYVESGLLDELLTTLSASFRSYIDLREPSEVVHPISELGALAGRLAPVRSGQTDLVLLPD
ncbi:MAG: FkbM family methyltransferase [Actinomycetota bacterium]|nr:FkbM family methyltransferase [Actinomycetota bacterium]